MREPNDGPPPRVALAVVLFGACSPFNESAYIAALDDNQNLELLLVGRPKERASVSAVRERYPDRVRYLELDTAEYESAAVQQGVRQLLTQGYDFVGYWAADVEVPLEMVRRWVGELSRTKKVLVFGSRLRLIQHEHPGLWHRHYAGRVLASVISLLLGKQIYDTDCCAKLFRNVEPVRAVFEKPFTTKVGYESELFARLLEQEVRYGRLVLDRDCMEFPLPLWRARKLPRYGLDNAHHLAADLLRVFDLVRGLGRPRADA